MTGHGEKLSRTQERAIAALLQQPTISKAAEVAGVAEVTLWRWLRLPAFQEEYRDARRQTVQQAIAQTQQITGAAVRTLAAIMVDTEAPAGSRVAAARAVLDTALKAVELEDMEARLVALEAAVAAQQTRRRA